MFLMCFFQKRLSPIVAYIWTRHASIGQLAKAFIRQPCAQLLADLPRAITDSDGWREKVKEIHVVGTP